VRKTVFTAAKLLAILLVKKILVSFCSLLTAKWGCKTHAEVAAKTSIVRAFVIRASTNAKQAENRTIRPSFKAFEFTRKSVTTDKTGRIEATTVERILRIEPSRVSS
jgi:hypothetical protein